MPAKRPRDAKTGDDSDLAPVMKVPKKRGRPPGSTNKNKLVAGRVDGKQAASQKSSDTQVQARVPPARATKKRKVLDSDPMQIRPVLSTTSTTGLVSSPGSSAGIVQDHNYLSYAPLASQPSINTLSMSGFDITAEKATLAGESQLPRIMDVSSIPVVPTGSPGSVIRTKNAVVLRSEDFSAGSIFGPAFLTVETSTRSGAATMTAGASGSPAPAGYGMVDGTTNTSAQLVTTSVSTSLSATTADASALPPSPTMLFTSGTYQPIAQLSSPCYGFKPSTNVRADEAVGDVMTGVYTGLSDGIHSLSHSLEYDFALDIEMQSFSDNSSRFSSSGSNTDGASDINYYETGDNLPWSQSPLDYTPPTRILPQPVEQPVAKASQDRASPNSMNLEMSTRLQKELFAIEEEGAEGKTDDSGSESESDNGEVGRKELKLKTSTVTGDLSAQTTNYVAPAIPPRSRPYCGVLNSSYPVEAADSHNNVADFVGTSYQSTNSSGTTHAKRKRKPRSDCTAALLRFGSIQLESYSSSPAPSSLPSYAGTQSILGTPEPTALSSNYEYSAQEHIDEDEDDDEIINNEDRAYYSGAALMVYDLARDLARLGLSLENAFPECSKLFKEKKEVKLQEILIKCVDDAIAHFGLQGDEFIQKNKYHMALGISKDRSGFRGDVKTCARKVVATILKVPKETRPKKDKTSKKQKEEDEPVSPEMQRHYSEVMAMIKDFFKDDKYLLGGHDIYGNRINYGSSLIQKVIDDFYYGSEQKLGFIFPKHFKKEVPEMVVALVASAVQCALMEYEKFGYLKTLRFDPKDFAKRYRRHVRGIQRLNKVPGHRKLFRAERRKWAKASWKRVATDDSEDGSGHEDEVHLELGFFLPSGVELSDSEEE